MADLTSEVARFREWANAYHAAAKYGEWECDYADWPALYDAVLTFVESRPFKSWNERDLTDVLYAIARDNEIQHLTGEIRKRLPDLIVPIAKAALATGEHDARWQLGVELGWLDRNEEVERLLLLMTNDEHEYVRRRALQSLLNIGSPLLEERCVAAWHRPDNEQEHTRIMVLNCLSKIGSTKLEPLLIDAEQDKRQYLRAYAFRIRRGEPLE